MSSSRGWELTIPSFFVSFSPRDDTRAGGREMWGNEGRIVVISVPRDTDQWSVREDQTLDLWSKLPASKKVHGRVAEAANQAEEQQLAGLLVKSRIYPAS